MERLRIGLVGAGGVAQRHARVLSGFDDVEVVAVADVDAARAAAVAGPVGALALGSLDELLDRARPDAVHLCVPPFAHGALEEAVLAAGLPMFVEKPLAADLPTAERLARAVADAGVVTATGYHWRHLDTLARLRAELDGGSSGTGGPVAAAAEWVGKVAPVGWWAQRSGSGGQVVEQATHVVDVLRVLLGEVASVQALSARAGVAGPVDDPAVVDDAVVALLRFASGAVATLEVSCVADRLVRAGVRVSAVGAAWELEEDRLVRVAGGEREVLEPAVDARTAVDRAFVDAVRTGDPSLVGADYAEALRTHRVACAVVEAARTGEVVHLPGGEGSSGADGSDRVVVLPGAAASAASLVAG